MALGCISLQFPCCSCVSEYLGFQITNLIHYQEANKYHINTNSLYSDQSKRIHHLYMFSTSLSQE